MSYPTSGPATWFVTGTSRGLGLELVKQLLERGDNVAATTRSTERLRAALGVDTPRLLALTVDLTDENAVNNAVAQAKERFGGIDVVVNNASAISLTATPQTDMKRYDLMQAINTRGTYMVTKYAVPHLERAANPHVLMLSPPLDMSEKWFAPHVAYSIAKYGMSLCVLGFAGEFRARGIAVNALWPRTTIGTAAIRNLLGGEAMVQASRRPEIIADAAYLILQKPSRDFSGNFLIDDTFLVAEGVTDLDRYRVDPSRALQPDFFVPDRSEPPASLGALK